MARLLCGAPSWKHCSAARHVPRRSLSCFAASRDQYRLPSISAGTHKPNHSMSVRMLWRLTMTSPAAKTTTPRTATRIQAMANNNLSAQLQQIGLISVPGQLDDFIARATKSRWSAYQMLEELVKAEAAERSRRSLERRLRNSGIKSFK